MFFRRSVLHESLVSQCLSPFKSIVATEELYGLGQRYTKSYDRNVGVPCCWRKSGRGAGNAST